MDILLDGHIRMNLKKRGDGLTFFVMFIVVCIVIMMVLLLKQGPNQCDQVDPIYCEKMKNNSYYVGCTTGCMGMLEYIDRTHGDITSDKLIYRDDWHERCRSICTQK